MALAVCLMRSAPARRFHLARIRDSAVNSMTSVGVSNYHGVVTSFKHRFVGRSQGLLQANYTYGRAFDEGSNGGLLLFVNGAGGNPINPQDPSNPHGAYGPADYDIRHSFNANYVWELPLKAVLEIAVRIIW